MAPETANFSGLFSYFEIGGNGGTTVLINAEHLIFLMENYLLMVMRDMISEEWMAIQRMQFRLTLTFFVEVKFTFRRG